MKPTYKIGDEVYIGSDVFFTPKTYIVFDICEGLDVISIREKGSKWDDIHECYMSEDGKEITSKHVKSGVLMSMERALEFMIDRFAYEINRHVMKTTPYDWWKPEKDEIISKLSKKIYDNR